MRDTSATLADALATLGPEDASFLLERPTETRRGAPVPAEMSLGGVEALETLAELSDGDALTVHGTLGVGGMAVVRLGRQERLGRLVAVKTLRDAVVGEPARVRLLREAWVTGRLEHPNIVPVHDVRLDDSGAPLVVLKRVDGVEWELLLAEPERLADHGGALDPLAWHVRVLATVCHAIQFAHDQGILHRDIKPSNVMIGHYGEVLLLDWGIAVSLEPDPSGLLPVYRPDGVWAGTPAYMAPEMLASGAVPQSRATDVYLLGAVLYRLLTGAPPHAGPDVPTMVASIVGPPPALPPDAPPQLARLCRAALDPDPSARPASALAFRVALERFLEQRAAEALTVAAEAELARLRAVGTDLGGVEHGRLASACEFGFKQALAVDPDSGRARDGLRETRLLVVEHALAHGNLETARVVAQHAGDVPDDVRARLAAAEAAEAARQAEIAALLDREDRTRGGWTRTIAVVGLGVVITVGGIVVTRAGGPPDYLDLMGFLGFGLGLSVLIRVALHRTVFTSHFNARMWAIHCLTMVGMALFDAANWVRGLPPHLSHSAHALFLAGCTACFGLVVDRRLFLAAGVYLLGYFAGIAWPAVMYDVIAACNGVLITLLAVVWTAPDLLRRGAPVESPAG